MGTRTTNTAGWLAAAIALVGALACGEEPGGSGGRDSGASGAGGSEGDAGRTPRRDSGSEPTDAGSDAGAVADAALSTDAGGMAPPLPSGTSITAGGGHGTSAGFRLQVGIGAPVPVARGASSSHRLSLGSPAVLGPQRR